MSKILIVFGSATGNTENIAHLVGKKLASGGHEVTVLNAADAKAEHLADGYDAALLGASCWGEDEIEMQDDFAGLFEKADQMGLKRVAAFASGDREYQYFCGAVDAIEARCKELGVEVLAEGLRLEGDGGGDDAEIEKFAAAVMAKL